MSHSSWGRVTGLAGLAWATALGFAPLASAQTAVSPTSVSQTAVPQTAADPLMLPSTPQAPARVAQLLYPSPDESPSIKVMGRGEATTPADQAKLTFSFATFDPSGYEGEITEESELSGESAGFDPSVEATERETPEEMPEDFVMPQPLTRASLKPVVDALKQAGVPDRNLSVEISEEASTGEIRVSLEKPSPARLQAISNAVDAALANPEIQVYLSDTQMRFEVRDCQPLEVKAYESAIANARRRAEAMAKALGSSINGTPRIAESPFDLFSPISCNEASPFSELMNLGGFLGNSVEPPKPEVTVKRDIFVTFPIR